LIYTRILSAMAVALGLTSGAALAQTSPVPTGEVILTVSGAVPVTDVGNTMQFDMEMLQSLGETSFTTSTPWTDGQQTFTGVSLKTFIDHLEVQDGNLSAVAINDYKVDIPVSDAVEDGPIIAYMRNGEVMSVRDKGPLWIVYPFDATEDYQAEVIYSRSIWQLDRIVVLE